MLVGISEAKGRLAELVRDAQDEDVILLRHGRPAAVIVGAERFDALMEELEDARDRMAVSEASETPDDMFIPLEKIKAEFGLHHD
jgi:prevent-host-death family protein